MIYIAELTNGQYSFLKLFNCKIEEIEGQSKRIGMAVGKIYECKEV